MTRIFAALLAILILPASAGAQIDGFRSLFVSVDRERAGLLWGRFDGDLRLDMLTADDSSIRLQLQLPDGSFAEPVALNVGEELGGALFDTVDLDGDGQLEIAFLNRAGVRLYSYDSEAGRFEERRSLVSGLRGISFLHLARQNFMHDVDGDGDDDILFPVDGRIYIYTQADGAFKKTGQLETDKLEVSLIVSGPELAQSTSTRVALPRLSLDPEDPESGDSTVSFGAGSGGGSFNVSTPSSRKDPLAPFKERHGIKNPEALEATLRDLDLDDIADYTIVYKNRIWVYKGTEDGFDFDRTPDQLLKVSAADRLSVALLPLNDDARPDLVIFKYRIPSVARIVAALAIGLRSEVEVLGYHNSGKPVFARKPSHRSTFIVKVPPLLSLMGRIEEIMNDFRDILRPMQSVSTGDFNGDGRNDIVRLESDQLAIYLSGEEHAELLDLSTARGLELLREYDGHKLMVSALFDRRRKDITLEKLMTLIGDVVDGLQAAIVADRKVSGRLPIDPLLAKRINEVRCKDLNGDGRDDIIVFYDNDKDDDGELIDGEVQTLQIWLSEPTLAAAAAAG